MNINDWLRDHDLKVDDVPWMLSYWWAEQLADFGAKDIAENIYGGTCILKAIMDSFEKEATRDQESRDNLVEWIKNFIGDDNG